MLSLEFEIPLVSLIFILIISVVYFSKKKVNLIENKAYKVILICSLIETIIDLIIHVICSLNEFSVIQSEYYNLFNILNKILSMLFIIIFTSLFYYIFIITYKKFKKSIEKVLIIINIASAIVLMFTNIELVETQNVTNVTGMTTMFAYFMVAIFLFSSLVVSVINFKFVDRRYVSIFLILGIMGILYALTLICPGIIIYDLVLALLCYIMYFTIENPDLKVVNELLRNKELIEQGMDDKSRFLFETSEEIKTPTKNIIEITKKFDKLNEDIDKKDAVRLISVNANNILFRLNNILDISSMDANKIKIKEDYYNTAILFNEIKAMSQNAIGDKNIALNFKISNNVPDSLNGDDVKIKQVLMSVILNCIKNTKEGYIRIHIDSIVRYEVARIIVNIEDTGIGMSIEKINDILDDRTELTDSDAKKLDKLDVDLKATIKIIKLLGGRFNIKSEKNKGTTFTIVIDQKCKIEETSKIMKNIEKYSSDVYGRKRVLIVDDNKEELFVISDILGNYNVDINTTMSGKDCVDRINAGEFYNLILVDDELKNNSAFAVLKKLKENKKFKVPVVVMLEKDKEHFKKYYLDDGFKNIILKENLSDELEKVISEYL